MIHVPTQQAKRRMRRMMKLQTITKTSSAKVTCFHHRHPHHSSSASRHCTLSVIQDTGEINNKRNMKTVANWNAFRRVDSLTCLLHARIHWQRALYHAQDGGHTILLTHETCSVPSCHISHVSWNTVYCNASVSYWGYLPESEVTTPRSAALCIAKLWRHPWWHHDLSNTHPHAWHCCIENTLFIFVNRKLFLCC